MRGVNRDSGKEKTVVEEHRSNFSKRKRGLSAVFSKRPKSSSWTHKFICLATTGQERVPAPVMKEDLLLARLGEKKIVIPDVDCTTLLFHDVLVEAFPKLKNAGGFELLHCIPNTRDLEGIPSPVCHSPRLLRSRMGTARIYIRPIQVDLDMEALDFEDNAKDVRLITTVYFNVCTLQSPILALSKLNSTSLSLVVQVCSILCMEVVN